jgi:GNAT superfamily N-acetyltransferase
MVKLHIAPCSREAARWALRKWHFTADFPKTMYHSYGVWEDDAPVGVITYSPPAMGVNVQKFFGLKVGELIELSRVALGPHKTPTSRIIAIATKLFLKRNPAVQILVTYCNPEIGHSGRNLIREPRTILDFIYVLPARRRGALGRQLVSWAAEQATHEFLTVHVRPDNAPSLRFCARLEFSIVGVAESGRAREPVLILSHKRPSTAVSEKT